MPGKRLTINDIARLAGVSKATVSRVLNHKPDVDPATRENILHIVEEQGFVPSIAAAGLAGGRSQLIGVLVPEFTWPFITDIMRGLAEVIGQTPYEMVLYSLNDRLRDKNRNKSIDHILATKLTAGLLAIFPGQYSLHLSRVYQPEFPVVELDDQTHPTDPAWSHSTVPWVGVDNRLGAYKAVCHLLRLGHTRIAHIQGPMRYQGSQERYQGYCQALAEQGIEVDPLLVQEGDFQPTAGRVASRHFFSLPIEQRPTAIFASNDQMAYGVIAAAEEFGLHIPEDVALVGFDDLGSSAHVHPALTTIRQPFYEMGRQGMELLLSLLERSGYIAREGSTWDLSNTIHTEKSEQEDEQRALRIYLPTNLVIRDSCGASRALIESDQF